MSSSASRGSVDDTSVDTASNLEPPVDPRRWILDRAALERAFCGTPFEQEIGLLTTALQARGQALLHGDLPRWRAALAALPDGGAPWLDASDSIVTAGTEGDDRADSDVGPLTIGNASTRDALMQLCPWRKGPYHLHGIAIDTEWRSDLKWDRLVPHLAALKGRRVLDVGSGSGYHLWRMGHAGAAAVLGIEPMLLYQCQFEALARCAPDAPVHQLPLRLEDLPDSFGVDTVFSMGVLYHAHEPSAHLERLHRVLRPGGQCVLETLVLDSEADRSLVIDDRYAGMRNIRQLPSTARLERWLAQAGFESVRRVSIDRTSSGEQRQTEWSTGHSLADALHPDDVALTVEGHPAPCRVILMGETSLTV